MTEPVYFKLLLEAAGRMGASVAEPTPGWTGPKFNAEVLSSSPSWSPVERHERDLPRVLAAARLDETPVLFGELSGAGNRTAIEEAIRQYHNQATIARSWLGGEAPNLQLFLIGPPNAIDNMHWRQSAAMIEADDRICRKLVWLFAGEPDVSAAEGVRSPAMLSP